MITLIKMALLIVSVGVFVYGVWTEHRADRRRDDQIRRWSARRSSRLALPPPPSFRRVWLGLDLLVLTYVVWTLDRGRLRDQYASFASAVNFYVLYLAFPGVLWAEFRAHKTFGVGPLTWVYRQEGLDVARRVAAFRWLERQLDQAAREPFRSPINLLYFVLGVPLFTLLSLIPFMLIFFISPFIILRAIWAFWFPRAFNDVQRRWRGGRKSAR